MIEKIEEISARVFKTGVADMMATGGSTPVEAAMARFALACGLAGLWRSWGITPQSVEGTGEGEFAAAWFRGESSLEDATAMAMARKNISSSPLKKIEADAVVEIGPAAFSVVDGNGASEWRGPLSSLAALYRLGAEVDWKGYDAGYPLVKSSAPHYPFQPKRHWAATEDNGAKPVRVTKELPGEKIILADPPGASVYRGMISVSATPWLEGHKIYGDKVFPGVGYMLMAVSAAIGDDGSKGPVEVSDIRFDNLIIVRGAEEKEVFTQCTPDADGYKIAIYSASNVNNMRCSIRKNHGIRPPADILRVEEIIARLPEESSGTEFYEAWEKRGFRWGEGFNNVSKLWTGAGEALTLVEVPPGSGFPLDVGVIDACGHSFAEVAGAFNKGAFVLKSVEALKIYRPLDGKKLWSYGVARKGGSDSSLTGDITIALETGEVAAEFCGVQFAFINAMAKKEDSQAAKETSPVKDEFRSMPPIEREKALCGWLSLEASRIFMIAQDELDINAQLGSLGMDSLMAMDLGAAISSRFGVKIGVVELMGEMSLAILATMIAGSDIWGTEVKAAPDESVTRVTAELAPLSYGQLALWFGHQMSPDSSAFHVVFAGAIRSELDVEALQRALGILAQRHSALRSVFTMVDGEVKRKIVDGGRIGFTVTPTAGWDDAAVREEVIKASRVPFDLEKGPLAKVDIFTRSPGDHVILVTVHHIVYDGWSLWILMEDMGKLYAEQSGGREAALIPLTRTYDDFTAWQKAMVEGEEGRKSLEYWTRRVSGDIAPLELPTDRPRPAVKTENGGTVNFDIPEKVSEGIRKLAKETNSTTFTVTLAAFFSFLHRYTSQETMLIGTSMAARPSSGYYGVVGDFMNPVVMRADIKKGQTFRSLLEETRSAAMETMERQDYPFGLLVEKLKVRRDPSRSPLYDIMFIFQKPQQSAGLIGVMMSGDSGSSADWGGLTMHPFGVPQQEGQMDLSLEIAETPNAILGAMKYNTDLFDKPSVARMVAHFSRMLASAVNSPDFPIASVPMLSTDERKERIEGCNATQAQFDMSRPVHEMFADVARRSPQSPAVIFENRRVTYGELNAASDRIASRLLEEGCSSGGLAAVFMERTPEALAAIIGAMKAGLAYVPVDPEYPAERTGFMLDDACPAAVLASSSTAARLTPGKWKVVVADLKLNGNGGPSRRIDEAQVSMDGLAYVIYTSGSTGHPKGVMITHGSLLNSTMARMSYYDDLPERYLLLSSLSFDSSVAGLFWTLLSGGAIVLPPRDFSKDIGSLAALIEKEKVTHTLALPSLYSLLISGQDARKLESLRVVIAAGEAIAPALVGRHFDLLPETKLYNEYGPTEGTVWCCAHKCGPDNGALTVPIGRPVANTKLYVLNDAMEPAPEGVLGELYIGGPQVAKGYLRQPALTEEKFAADPFSPGGRLYRTGDIARRRRNGDLEFIGRVDGQVKIRGYRIELGEIETTLAGHPSVKEAAVTALVDASGDKRIVAYITTGDSAVDVLRIKEYLGGKLPGFMIPSAIVTLDKMPLSPNGKLDRKALPAPDISDLRGDNGYSPPSNEMETLIESVWSGLLNVEKVGARDNFFDIGGHSLLMARAHVILREKIARDFSIVQMYKNPTIESLAACLAGNGDGGNGKPAALAAAQERGGRRGEMGRMRAAKRGQKTSGQE
jgi:amino acid adenylation domain-containing protein